MRASRLGAVATLVLLAAWVPVASRASAASWQISALSQLQELESNLALKEQHLLQVRTGCAAGRAAEERGGRRIVRRAAFDVGSAACKIVVADVDLHVGSVANITRTIFSERVAVSLCEDLAAGPGRKFSERTLQELHEVLHEFKKRAEQQGAEQFAGIATAAFRKASNGAAFLQQLHKEGLPLRIISQEREAFLGFLTANHLCPEIQAFDLVSWDCGGGSFQITAEVPPAWEAWMKSVGTGVAKTLLLTTVQKKKDVSASPNPVTLLEAQALAKEIRTLIGEPPEWLTDKIRAPGVHFAAIGGETSLFRLASELIDGTCISKARLLEAIENLCGKTDLQLRLMEDVPSAMKQPQSVIPKLVLLYAILNALGCDEVSYYDTNGNTPGILMTEELWRK